MIFYLILVELRLRNFRRANLCNINFTAGTKENQLHKSRRPHQEDITMTSGKEKTQPPNYRRLGHGGKNITYVVNKNVTEDNSKN